MPSIDTGANFPEWAQLFFDNHARFKIAWGGRGSGKTWCVGGILVIESARRPLKIVCARETQKSIRDSAYSVIRDWIYRLKLEDQFDIQRDRIYHQNGSEFLFIGISNVTEENIRGLENVGRLWFEEAQAMSESSREILYPTIFRNAGTEAYFTFNPRYQTDPVWQQFCVGKPESYVDGTEAIVIRVNYYDNPWFSAEADAERRRVQRDQPDRYAHIYLGELDDAGEGTVILPYSRISKCVGAHKKLGLDISRYNGRIDGGIDLAGSGEDKNCLALRKGSFILSVNQWRTHEHEPGPRAHRMANEVSARRLYYDAGGGYGDNFRKSISDIAGYDQRSYVIEPVLFGESVRGPEEEFVWNVTNKDYFLRRNSQMAWALKVRMDNTITALDGGDYDPDRCLFIDEDMPNLEEYLRQLSQPRYEENATGRIQIDKDPNDVKSPDMFDATCLAFCWDSEDGLRHR